MNLLDHIRMSSVHDVAGAISCQHNCTGYSLNVCGGDCDKHQAFSAVAVASWEAIDRAAVVLTNCPGDAGVPMNL